MLRESVSVFCRHFECLLLSDEEFGNLSWEPPGRLEEFCHERLRPALLLVHRCTLEGTDPRIISPEIPPEEKEELCLILLHLMGTIRFLSRARLTRCENMRIPELARHVPAAQITAAAMKYCVPGVCTDLFMLTLLAFDRAIDGRGVDRKALSVGYSILMDLYQAASEHALEDGCPTNFAEFCRGKELCLDVPLEKIIPAELLPQLVRSSGWINRPRTKATGKNPVNYRAFQSAFDGRHQSPDTGAHVSIIPGYSRGHDLESGDKVRRGTLVPAGKDARVFGIGVKGKLSDILIQHGRLAADLRVPAPRVAWLFSVMRADQLYGFSGDKVRIWRAILRGKMASLYQYSERLRQRAANRSASEDDALAQGAAQMAVNRDDYCGSPQGEVAYAQNFLRPFAHIIRSSIPSTVCGPDNMPFGRAAELEKYVLVYIERAAVTFDYFLGRPTYGYVPGARNLFLSHISMAANLANKARGPSSALDVPLTPDFASLPQVPSWSCLRIALLESLELINSWACENALLEDGIEQTQNVGRALEKSVTHADMGYAPNLSGRYFV
ncbi:hypothetical protein DFH08DRAFT_819562 [Mycena albidolilacea]|uniref:Uncharacterized protein n=1 Tax=Mycena albidolilacea TaxID=1033008 RepID=A0AAD6ZF08_9AGAR|nr:hypothetical protein DFH08DRAFT_819562 [Mycena albidolilacea]